MHLLILFLLRLVQPDPPIVIAHDTTFIDAPLRRDGLPDYEKCILDQCRTGVTPENNGAVPFWQAMWPTNLERSDYEPMRRELGLQETPPEKSGLQLLGDEATQRRIIKWLQLKPDETDPSELIWPAATSAWTEGQFPPLAEWVHANKKPLDLLVAASRRPRFYSPSPTFLNQRHETLIEMLLPGSQNVRDAARALGTRAMLNVGENRLNDAWNDLLAMHRLSRLVSQGPNLVDQLIAIAVAGMANDGTLALLSSDRLTPELARRVQKDLDSLPTISHMVDCVDNMERLSALDTVVHMKLYGVGRILGALVEDQRGQPGWMSSIAFDGNVVMRRLNRWYDRMVAIMRIPDRKTREKEFDKFETDLDALGQHVKRPSRIIAAVISVKSRSETLSSVLAALLIPAIRATSVAEDRGAVQLQLIRLAAALAVYRAEHGKYPAKLDDLTPGVVAKLPTDVYNSKPFIYQRTADGYLLYRAGNNGVDDRGDNSQMSMLAGRSIEELPNSETSESQPVVPPETDDWSVVLPHPKFKLKTIPAGGPTG